jgi:hypothetical protein
LIIKTHLERNSGSEIPTELNKIYTSLKEYIFKIERQEALKVSSDEQYDKVQSLEVDKKIEELEKMYDQFLELSMENSSMGEWAETYKSFVERDIEVTKEPHNYRIHPYEQWLYCVDILLPVALHFLTRLDRFLLLQ